MVNAQRIMTTTMRSNASFANTAVISVAISNGFAAAMGYIWCVATHIPQAVTIKLHVTTT